MIGCSVTPRGLITEPMIEKLKLGELEGVLRNAAHLEKFKRHVLVGE